MSDTHSEDDRKPAAVKNREPRDVEKGEGGGGRLKLPPSATTTQPKRARSSSSRHNRSHKHSHKHKHHHRDGDDEKIAANDAPEMDNKHKRSHKHSHKHSDKHRHHRHDKSTREAHEKIGADNFARAPTTDEKWTAFSSLAGITESIKPSYKYSNEEGYKKEIDEDKVANLSEPLTYAPSLMAHVYRHDAAATNSRNEIEKEKAVVDASIRNNRDYIGFETGMEATMEPFASVSAHQEDQLIDNKLEEDTFGANFEPVFGHNGTSNIPAASIPTPPPPQQTQPGAIRVGGIDEENADVDNDSMTNMTVQNSPVDPNNPVSAEVFDEDEENRRIQEKVERERERQRAEQEGEIPEAEIVTEKQNCNTRDKIWSVVAVILLVTVAVVLGTVLPPQIKANSNQTTDPATPSQQEVIQELESLLIPVTFDNGTALRTASSPQNKALIWLSNNTDINSYSNATKIQRYALATLFYCTNGNSWFSKSDWRSNRDECYWDYVVCDENHSLETLDLSSNNLFGTIPNELALLSNLTVLDLSINSLTATIPSEVGLLSNLTQLDLSENNLTGTIPSQIGLLTILTDLYLSYNSLTGTIPSKVGLLTKLNVLQLSINSLMGTIPSEVGLLTKLSRLDLSKNNLVGMIPSQLGLLTKLTVLDLSINSLTGTIPSQIALMSNFDVLDLYSNNFMGEFTCPAFIDDCWISCDYETDTYTQACRSL